VLLDEAQNTTVEQMKMFLTRLGYDSKMVVNGDVGQSDLPKGLENGLKFAHDRLLGSDSEIGCVEFTAKHIVRNPLIAKMLQHLDGPSPQTENIVRHSFLSVAEQRVANG
jgi:phosphate starvation-inducible PhoH-like protein